MSSTSLFWWLVAVNLLLFIVVLVQLNFVRGMASALNGPRERTEARKEEHGFAQNVLERLTRSVDVAHEEDVLMHHDYDGIRELDNVLPPWWLWLFYGTIIWGVVYVINVHVIHVWPDQRTAYEQEMAQAKADVAAYMANFANLVDENTAKELTDESSIAQGKAIFTSLCTACHGPNAAGFEGSVGPNLTDGYWLHGGGIRNVFHTITYGVPEKGMISWKDQLKPSEIQLVASFILSQKGQVEGGKAPQGELWEPAPASTDSTAAPAPSAVTDSSAVAQM
ncbi:MAG: c-type cytochrome [Flavobacteriales bacterium]|nr:c-type cytochrome [Flavobacteriales bacterium]MCB9171033.1 c-type cytochrome [Flavobacteriales bacterium]